jgi:hypothetical protein
MPSSEAGKEHCMRAKLVIASLVVIGLSSPVLAATYYVVQSTRTQQCSLAIRKPLAKSKALALVGAETGYKSRREALEARRTIGVCR